MQPTIRVSSGYSIRTSRTSPFNIENINGNLYVTYAKVNSMGVGQPGGFVDEYDTSGTFIKPIATMGAAPNAPWGITLAPGRFGQFSNDLPIGQSGDGQVLAYDPSSDAFLGTLNGRNGMPIDNPRLWVMNFPAGEPNTNSFRCISPLVTTTRWMDCSAKSPRRPGRERLRCYLPLQAQLGRESCGAE